MIIECVWEHNGDDSILFSSNIVGAFTRGASKEEVLRKMPGEALSFGKWSGTQIELPLEVVITQEKASDLNVRDADSDVLFDSERMALTAEEYEKLKRLSLKSARDFQKLYESFPDKNKSALKERDTFYGKIPRTAEEMYLHTKNVNGYYWGEIEVPADNDGTIFECRSRGFDALEKTDGFLSGRVFDGSYGEEWSLPKVLRRFIWHDRIHAKAMYRMGVRTFGADVIPDIFGFAR
jgi:hypothetical protein